MITEEELLSIREKLYDNEKHPYINGRLIAKKLFEELILMKESKHMENYKGKEGEAGKSPQEYILELERAILDSECNLELQKYQKEYIEQLLRAIDNNNEFNKKITVCNQELQSYHGLLESLVERYEKSIIKHKNEICLYSDNLEMIAEINEKLWSEIYNPEIVRSQFVTKELEKENADLKVKLQMALGLLSVREQMLVNLEESRQK